MVTTTLLLTLASLGGGPAVGAPAADAALLRQPANAVHLFVPTGIAVPVRGQDAAGRPSGLFARRDTGGAPAVLAVERVPEEVAASGVTLIRPAAPPFCRF